MAFIKIEGLTKNFGAFRALNGIDISISEKEFVTLLGPSGCGKTTTLRILAGFLTPDAGSVAVGGEVISSPEHVVQPEQRRMGMVFQNYAVWPHMSVRENVAFGLRYSKLPRKEHSARVEQILASMGLDGLENRHPGELSGGQQQRVALARSLVVEPSILLLDEPLSNLDAKLREHMRSELKSLQRRTGITFVYVTHDQAEAMALSDRIVVFRRGSVQQVGTPREVYEQPANLFVADFMGLVNRVEGVVAGSEGDALIVDVGGHRIKAIARDAVAVSGAPVTVAIRPEALAFGNSAESRVNTLKGVVVDATFLGNIVDYQVNIGGVTLRVQGERGSSHPAGSEVALTVPVAECVAMTEEAGQMEKQPPQSGKTE
jgi:iron(III) transport system ATP-binding protein